MLGYFEPLSVSASQGGPEQLEQIHLGLDLSPFLVAQRLEPLIEDIGRGRRPHEHL